MKLGREFFQRDPLVCAAELVGCELVWGRCSGVVVETEAYSVVGDEACHTFNRPSSRVFVAQKQAGSAYIYLNYGMYWLLNVLVKNGREDGFVLIRALEPSRGLGIMRKRRGLEQLRALCSGPGKLSQALGITGEDHGRDLCGAEGPGFHAPVQRPVVVSDVRIGISKAADLPWRFLLEGSPFHSVPVTGTKKRPAR